MPHAADDLEHRRVEHHDIPEEHHELAALHVTLDHLEGAIREQHDRPETHEQVRGDLLGEVVALRFDL